MCPCVSCMIVWGGGSVLKVSDWQTASGNFMKFTKKRTGGIVGDKDERIRFWGQRSKVKLTMWRCTRSNKNGQIGQPVSNKRQRGCWTAFIHAAYRATTVARGRRRSDTNTTWQINMLIFERYCASHDAHRDTHKAPLEKSERKFVFVWKSEQRNNEQRGPRSSPADGPAAVRQNFAAHQLCTCFIIKCTHNAATKRNSSHLSYDTLLHAEKQLTYNTQ